MHFGENRVQEAAGKFPELRQAHPAMRLHIIGGLQTNKARDAVRLADVIRRSTGRASPMRLPMPSRASAAARIC